MINGEDLDTSSKDPKKAYKDLHRLLTNFSDTTEYRRHSGKRCCHQQNFQMVYPLPGEDTAEHTSIRILSELKLKELLTRKKNNRENARHAETKLV